MADFDISGAIGGLYDAALDRELWPKALDDIGRLLNGHSCTLFLVERHTAQVALGYFPGFAPDAQRDYRSYYSMIEPGWPFLKANPGLPLYNDHMWIEEREMDRHEFYAWLETQCSVRYRLTGIVCNTTELYGIAALQRTRGQGPPGELEQKTYLRVLPHIRRAVRISEAFSTFESNVVAEHEILDRLPTGVLLFDRRCRLILMNRTAEYILAEHDGLALDSTGNLCASLPGETQNLARAVFAAIDTGAQRGKVMDASLPITRPSGRRSYAVLVAPLGDRRGVLNLRPTPAVVVFISDPEREVAIPSDLLRRIFILSPAEVELTLALVRGLSLTEAANHQGISLGTARNRLKAIFLKTDTHTQAELIRLVLSMAGPLSEVGQPNVYPASF